MAAAEQAIMAGAAAALAAAGLTVFAGRTEPMTEDEMPCVIVRTPTTSGQELGHSPAVFTETAQLVVSCYVRSLVSEAAAESAANALEQTARVALLPCPAEWLGGPNARVVRLRSQMDAPPVRVGAALRARHLFLDVEYSQEYLSTDEPISLDSVNLELWAKRLPTETKPSDPDIEATIDLAPEEEP